MTLLSTKADFAIGNPPFGKRSSLAINFINHSAELCEAIAFILPVSFMKWGVQKQINNNLKLVDYFYLNPNSFTNNGKDFSVRCVFQLWVKTNGKYDNIFLDKRLKSNRQSNILILKFGNIMLPLRLQVLLKKIGQ